MGYFYASASVIAVAGGIVRSDCPSVHLSVRKVDRKVIFCLPSLEKLSCTLDWMSLWFSFTHLLVGELVFSRVKLVCVCVCVYVLMSLLIGLWHMYIFLLLIKPALSYLYIELISLASFDLQSGFYEGLMTENCFVTFFF